MTEREALWKIDVLLDAGAVDKARDVLAAWRVSDEERKERERPGARERKAKSRAVTASHGRDTAGHAVTERDPLPPVPLGVPPDGSPHTPLLSPPPEPLSPPTPIADEAPAVKAPKTTWLTPVEQALDRTGFTIPKAKTEPAKAKAFYSWIGKELSRAFTLHGGTDRDAFTRFVVWTIEEDIGGRWPSDIEGDPLKCVRYLAAVLRNPEVVARYKVAIKPATTTADLDRWQVENDRKIAEARSAGAYGPVS